MQTREVVYQSRRRSSVSQLNTGLMILVFIVWPFLAFLLAVRNYAKPVNRRIILCFFVLFGFTFIPKVGMDSSHYASELLINSQQPFSDFIEIASNLYDEGVPDITKQFITFVVSRFTNSHHWLFATFALLFGYFYLKSITFFFKKYQVHKNSNARYFLLFLPWVLPIFAINGFRMWTATWIFFYGAINIIYYGRKKYILLCLFSTLVHVSFLSANAILLAWIIIGNRKLVWVPLAIGTFFVSELPFDTVQNYAQSIGGAIGQKIITYTTDYYVEGILESLSGAVWFIEWRGKLLLYFFAILLVIYGLKIMKEKSTKPGLQNLFYASLAFLSFSNVSSLMPSGGRFRVIFFLLCCSFFIVYFSRYRQKQLLFLNYLGIAFLALYALVEFRIGSPNLNTFLFFPTPVMLANNDLEWAVYDWMFER